MRPGSPINGVCEVPTSRTRNSVWARSRTGVHVGLWNATRPTTNGRTRIAARSATTHRAGADAIGKSLGVVKGGDEAPSTDQGARVTGDASLRQRASRGA